MASVEELLMNSLKDLLEAELKDFQWYLQKDHECISKSDMENADRVNTVDKMVACFGPEDAVKITVRILGKMNQNNLAEQLENKHKKENINIDFIQQFLCQQSPPCHSISPYAVKVKVM
uniref:Pyrin domain-containing protein n=1 Tax=Cyprinus carpio TaxID=7962 RepID=A0A8C2FIE2_CYPCA